MTSRSDLPPGKMYDFVEPVTEESVAGLTGPEKQALYAERRDIWRDANVRCLTPEHLAKKGRPR